MTAQARKVLGECRLGVEGDVLPLSSLEQKDPGELDGENALAESPPLQ